MPIYEYTCSECHSRIELIQNVGAAAPDICPQCGALASLRKAVTSASFVLKGGGWYETDFKNKGASCGSEGKFSGRKPDHSDSCPGCCGCTAKSTENTKESPKTASESSEKSAAAPKS